MECGHPKQQHLQRALGIIHAKSSHTFTNMLRFFKLAFLGLSIVAQGFKPLPVQPASRLGTSLCLGSSVLIQLPAYRLEK